MNTNHIPALETPRLRLRAFDHADFDAYAAMWEEAEVVRFIGGAPLTREGAWSRFLRQMGAWHYLGFGSFAIEDKASGAFIGEAGFHDLHRNITPLYRRDARGRLGVIGCCARQRDCRRSNQSGTRVGRANSRD